MWRSLRVGVSAVFLGLAGCATTPSPQGTADRYNELFDDKLKILFATQFPVASAEDAMKKGDEALRNAHTDLALFNYIRALELDASSYEALYKIGSIYASRGNRRLAELAYRWTLQLANNHPGALEGVGLILLEKRQYDGAQKALAGAIRADPRRWRAHNALGVIADLRQRYSEAESHYRAALQFVPNSPIVLNNLGYSKYLSGDWIDARRMFEIALNYDSRYERAWMNLGLLHTRMGRYDKAVLAFRRVMDEPSAYNNVGYVLMVDGNDETAETFFRKAIQLSPSYYATANENLKRISTLPDQPRQVSSRDTPEEKRSGALSASETKSNARAQPAYTSRQSLLDGILFLPAPVKGEPVGALVVETKKKKKNETTSETKDDAAQNQGQSALIEVKLPKSLARTGAGQPKDGMTHTMPSSGGAASLQEQ